MLGVTNTYLIKSQIEDTYIMIDAGSLYKEKSFLRKISKLGIKPSQIKLIIITHAHFDHIGSLAEIKKHCACPVIMHAYEADIIKRGEVVIPPGTNMLGNIISHIGTSISPIFKFTPMDAEIKIEEDYALNAYGINGRIILTPGHTLGSLSVLLDDGSAFVGDLAVNFFYTYPPFAVEQEEIYLSWKKIIEQGAKVIYPAHGLSFEISRLVTILAMRKGLLECRA